MSLTCPLTKQSLPIDRCANVQCPYYSNRPGTGCFHSSTDTISISVLAHHKQIQSGHIKGYLQDVDTKVKHALLLLKYSEFCSDVAEDKVTAKDQAMFEYATRFEPYIYPALRNLNVYRWKRMKSKKVFKHFQQVMGISLAVSVKEFLTKFPLSFD